MAIYFLHVKTFGRGKGSKVTRAAAYRAGVRIRDERTGAVYDYTDRTDVARAEIVLPTACIGRVDMAWALDRAALWNAAEHAGRRSTRTPERPPARAKVPAPAAPAQNAAAPRPTPPAVSAEQSVKNWLAYRQTHPEVTAQQSLDNWLAYRERQAQAAATGSPSKDRSVEPGAVGSASRDGEPRKRTVKSRRRHDASL
jgi:hypothetical protein